MSDPKRVTYYPHGKPSEAGPDNDSGNDEPQEE